MEKNKKKKKKKLNFFFLGQSSLKRLLALSNYQGKQ